MRARELADSQGQSSTPRRALLTGGAAGLAAVAATTLGGAQPASATTQPSITDWLNVTNFGAKGDGSTDDWAAIHSALNAATEGQVVYLPQGKYVISQPLVIQKNGITLRGSHGAAASGDDASKDLGAVLVIGNPPTTPFTNPNSWSNLVTGAIVIIQQNPGAGNHTNTDQNKNPSSNRVSGVRVSDLWIDGTNSPAAVDGVACFGAIGAWQAERVGCYKITGKAFPQYTDTSWTPGSAFPDGQHMYSCMAEVCQDHAFYGSYVDATLIDCHAQNSSQTATPHDGFYLNGGANNRLIGCRSDLNQNGFTLDAQGAGTFYDCITMIGCGTQGNTSYGLNVINSSSNGTGPRAPVTAVGCTFDQDGLSSVYASGLNLVELSACSLLSGNAFSFNKNSGSPANSITCAAQGSSNGPTVIMNGGRLNPVTTAVVSGAANASLLQVNNAVFAVGLDPASNSYTPYPHPANAPSFSSNPVAPQGTTSGATGTDMDLVMMGLGSTWVFTPTGTGLVQVTVTGYGNTTSGLTWFRVGARYGIVTPINPAPGNGVAVTGNRFGSGADPAIEGGAAGRQAGLAFTAILPLIPGTTYWFDLALATGDVADTAHLADLSITITELAQ